MQITLPDTQIHRYDLILIDEAEQVFSHLLADTMKGSRSEVLHAMKFYMQHAKSVYLLDADLGRTTVEIVEGMLEGAGSSFSNRVFDDWLVQVNLLGFDGGDNRGGSRCCGGFSHGIGSRVVE